MKRLKSGLQYLTVAVSLAVIFGCTTAQISGPQGCVTVANLGGAVKVGVGERGSFLSTTQPSYAQSNTSPEGTNQSNTSTVLPAPIVPAVVYQQPPAPAASDIPVTIDDAFVEYRVFGSNAPLQARSKKNWNLVRNWYKQNGVNHQAFLGWVNGHKSDFVVLSPGSDGTGDRADLLAEAIADLHIDAGDAGNKIGPSDDKSKTIGDK